MTRQDETTGVPDGVAHTPGPFRVDESLNTMDEGPFVVNADGAVICEAMDDEAAAVIVNALNAAPLMLEALRRNRQGLLNLIELRPVPPQHFDGVRDEIAALDAIINAAAPRTQEVAG